MSRRVTRIIEIAAFLILAVLVVQWIQTQDGRYEPWTMLCGLVAGGLELYRRYWSRVSVEADNHPGDTDKELLPWLLANASAEELSVTLPRALRLAQKLGDKDFEKWVCLELYGYEEANGMSESDLVPEYRRVTGRYLNAYGQPLPIEDPDLSFVNRQVFHFGVRELENYAKRSGMLGVIDEELQAIIRQNFGFDAVQFRFHPTAIIGVLDTIRSRLIDRLHGIKDAVDQRVVIPVWKRLFHFQPVPGSGHISNEE